jgi:hypothetical protein
MPEKAPEYTNEQLDVRQKEIQQTMAALTLEYYELVEERAKRYKRWKEAQDENVV